MCPRGGFIRSSGLATGSIRGPNKSGANWEYPRKTPAKRRKGNESEDREAVLGPGRRGVFQPRRLSWHEERQVARPRNGRPRKVSPPHQSL